MLSNCDAGEDSLESPLDSKEIKQSILKAVNYEYLLKELMLKLQYFFHMMQKANSLEKTPILGKIEGRRRRGRQSIRWSDGIIDSMDMSQTPGDGEGQESLECCSPWGHKKSDMIKQLKNKLLFLNIFNFSYCIIMVTNFQPDISKEIPYFFPQNIFLRSRITQTKIINI